MCILDVLSILNFVDIFVDIKTLVIRFPKLTVVAAKQAKFVKFNQLVLARPHLKWLMF
jgi:hypothetical protein